MKVRRISGELLVLLALAMAGCGSSDGGAAPDGGAPGGTGGGLTWLDNGTRHTALYPSAARVTSAMLDMVQVAGGEASGVGIAFGVSMPPPLVPGSYPCGVSGNRIIVSFSYANAGVSSSCTVTITSVGAATGGRATGTFSAVFGATMITGGTFDLPLTVNKL
jgi:hypothetical protein